MFEFSVLFSAILGAIFYYTFRSKSADKIAILLVLFFGIFLITGLGLFLPFVIGQFLILTLFVFVSRWRPMKVQAIFACSIAVYLIVGIKTCLTVVDLRNKFPLEPIANRLPPANVKLTKTGSIDDVFWDKIEYQLDRKSEFAFTSPYGNRITELEYLHANAYVAFSRASGFGSCRMMTLVVLTEATLTGEPDLPLPKQPFGPRSFTFSASDHQDLKHLKEENRSKDDEELHGRALLSFLDPMRFGYVKSRFAVAGFRPHLFSGRTHWQELAATSAVRTIDLVGAVLQDPPVVYLSNNLPSMMELSGLLKRPLQRDESLAFRDLAEGKDVVRWRSTSGNRAMGAIRATRQCTECHACPRGALLGAFLYSFQ